MYVRPLDLLSRLRPEPRSFDWIHFLNAGILILFFTLFGSRFVLSPAIVIDQPVKVPGMPSSSVALTASTCVVSIKANGQIFTPDAGRVSFEQLEQWLEQKARLAEAPTLLIIADQTVSYRELSRLYAVASRNGFKTVALAAEPASSEL